MTIVGYHLRLLVLRQSVLAPTLSFLALLGAIYASDAGAPVPAASVSAVALMPVCAWLTRLVATAESEPFAEVTLVSAGGRLRHLAARAGTVLVVGVALTAISILWAAVANPHRYDAEVIIIIAGMSLAEVLAGIGIGLWLEPPVPAGTAVVAVVLITIVSLVVSWMPPLGPLLHGLDRSPVPGAARLFVDIGQGGLLGLLLLLARASSAR